MNAIANSALTRNLRPAVFLLVFMALVATSCSSSQDQPDNMALAEDSAESDRLRPAIRDNRGTKRPSPASGPFSEDFRTDSWTEKFEFAVFHRDDEVIKDEVWLGDHSIDGPNDLCGPPAEKRTISRGERATNFNDEWIYRCVPGGDREKAHIMTSIGDTSGYSIGSFSPRVSFENISEIRWDVNITDLGLRQFTEAKVIPAGRFDFQNLPCAIEWLPCDTTNHGDLGSVGVSFFNHELAINTGTQAPGEPYDSDDDPALDDVAIRRTHVFTDNGDGTVSYSVEREDGSFQTITEDGSFPDGPVRVVFSDHNYTPEKDSDPLSFTWHWDNIEIDMQESGS